MAGTNPAVERFADMFAAMGNEARLRIMRLLLAAHPQGLVVKEIQAELEMPGSTLSHHLEKLKQEGLVDVRREGTFLWCTANTAALREVLEFLYAECCTRTQAIPDGKILFEIGEEAIMDVKEIVKEKYGEAALRVVSGQKSCCCGTTPSGLGQIDPITRQLYSSGETSELPEAAVLASLGCGNPTALAQLAPGEVVLDLGSGGGIDVLLSARRVGPAGKAYGLDMTDPMLALARENQKQSGLTNVEFLKGEIENIPLPDNTVDVVISNCVINLSADKDRVLAEVFRVLKPGGRFAVSDIVVRGEVPQEIKRSMELWAGCVAGALEENDYKAKLARAGFEDVGVEPTRVYNIDDARDIICGAGLDFEAVRSQVADKYMSAFIRASKPLA